MEIINLKKERSYIYEFYTKGLDYYIQKRIWGLIEHLNYYDWLYDGWKEDGFEKIVNEGIFENAEIAMQALCKMKEECRIINNIMIEYERYPLFENMDDVDYLIQKRDELLLFLTEEECCKIIGCKSFAEHEPKIYII